MITKNIFSGTWEHIHAHAVIRTDMFRDRHTHTCSYNGEFWMSSEDKLTPNWNKSLYVSHEMYSLIHRTSLNQMSDGPNWKQVIPTAQLTMEHTHTYTLTHRASLTWNTNAHTSHTHPLYRGTLISQPVVTSLPRMHSGCGDSWHSDNHPKTEVPQNLNVCVCGGVWKEMHGLNR